MAGLVRLTPGEVFANRFEVQAALAEGGMGTVYAVMDREARERRALKVLLPELVAEERSRRRFTQEAKVGAQIDSPYVPRVFASGIDDASGVPWIAMELLEGRDLRQHIRERGPLSIDEAGPILEQIGSALAAAHRRGLVHRDLKPENVFLHTSGATEVVKLLDFGVAKVIDLHRTSATGTGAIGSPMWMSPEQTSAGGRIAPSTDVWSLALLTFFMLTGRFYWKAAQDDSGVAGLLRELHLDPIEPASQRAALLAPHITMPAGLDAWFLRAMQRASTERFRDADEAMEALRAILTPTRPSDRSAMAYAQTLVFESGEVPALVDDGIHTAPMEAVHLESLVTPGNPDLGGGPTLNDSTPSSPRVASAPEPWEAEGGRTIADPGSAPSVPVTHDSELPAVGWEPNTLPSERVPTTETRPLPDRGPSPLVWFVVLAVAGVAVAALTAVIVWVVLTVT